MYVEYAKADCLSCLINTNRDMEHRPEPFRMQRNVHFCVTYSEYVDYILSAANSKGVTLLSDINVTTKLALINHPRLFNYFLLDMAFAIIKELYFAEFYKKKATVILPASTNNENVGLSTLLSTYDFYVSKAPEFAVKCASVGFDIPKSVSTQNWDLYRLAIVLYGLSQQDRVVEEVNLVCDVSL